MQVREIMSQPVHECSPHDTLAKAASTLWEHDCGALPVVDSKGRVGAMLTDRDVCMGAYTKGKRLADLAVADSMSRELICCKATDDLATAAALMAEHRIRRLPVLDEKGALCGMLSLNDMARRGVKDAAIGALVLKALASVCEPRPGRTDAKLRAKTTTPKTEAVEHR